MKKIYQHPELTIVRISMQQHLLQASETLGEGQSFKQGDVVLSRGRGRFTDDDEE